MTKQENVFIKFISGKYIFQVLLNEYREPTCRGQIK